MASSLKSFNIGVLCSCFPWNKLKFQEVLYPVYAVSSFSIIKANSYTNKKLLPFGMKMCSKDISAWALPVLRSEQFSENEAQGKL